MSLFPHFVVVGKNVVIKHKIYPYQGTNVFPNCGGSGKGFLNIYVTSSNLCLLWRQMNCLRFITYGKKSKALLAFGGKLEDPKKGGNILGWTFLEMGIYKLEF